MFNVSTRRRFIQRLRTPVRPNELRLVAEKLMRGTRYTDLRRFINALLDEDIIRPHILEARNGKRWTLYTSHPIEEFSPYQIAASLFLDGYFCNLTAIYHHGLTDQVPKAVYMCHETIRSNPENSTRTPSESQMRTALIKPHRHTNHVMPFQGHDIVVVDRVTGSDYGVVKVTGHQSPCPTSSRVAGLERALIDAVVTPQYNGGITSLPAYFRAAQRRFNLNQLLMVYHKLRLVYPYAQAIGFLMEHAGMREQADQLREVYRPRCRFFIDHNAKTSWDYNERWLLYHPRGLAGDD